MDEDQARIKTLEENMEQHLANEIERVGPRTGEVIAVMVTMLHRQLHGGEVDSDEDEDSYDGWIN